MITAICLLSVILFVSSTAGQNVPPTSTGPPQPVKVESGHYNFAEKGEVHDKEHLKIHLGDQIDIDNEGWNPEKEMFHYFSMHDLNKDSVIDGLEVLKAITHDHSDHGPAKSQNMIAEESLERMVDDVMKDIDVNNDGFIDYGEYVAKQKKG